MFYGDIAYEPFSFQRYDGVLDKKNYFDQPQDRLISLRYDQDRSFWRAPLEVLAMVEEIPSLPTYQRFTHQERLVYWLPSSYLSDSNGLQLNDVFVQDQDPIVFLYMKRILQGDKDPDMDFVMKLLLKEEIVDVWPIDSILDTVIWWKSQLKKDPRLANTIILE